MDEAAPSTASVDARYDVHITVHHYSVRYTRVVQHQFQSLYGNPFL